jgi:hypothetical protein
VHISEIDGDNRGDDPKQREQDLMKHEGIKEKENNDISVNSRNGDSVRSTRSMERQRRLLSKQLHFCPTVATTIIQPLETRTFLE